MRLSAGVCLLATTSVIAAPQKDDLPHGAVGRLGAQVSPTAGARTGEVNVLLYLGENTLLVGTNAGWRMWDLQKKQPRQARPVGGPAFAVGRDASRIFVGSGRKLHAIEPVESAMAEPARSWDSAADAVDVVAVSPAGNRVVYADGDRKLTVLDPATGKPTGVAELIARPAAAALAANGRILAVVTRDGAARVYGLSGTGVLETHWVRRVAKSDRAVVQFSPDGRLLAVTSAGRVSVLESVTGRPFATLERKFGEGDVRAVAFSPDGLRLAAAGGGPEPVVRVWDVEAGRELVSFVGHRGEVNAVAFAPGGRTLASAGSDEVVLLWNVPPTSSSEKTLSTAEAWESLDALDGVGAHRAVGGLFADRKAAVVAIRDGYRGTAAEQEKMRRWIRELDHDEFRVREVARRSLVKAGLRATAAIKDPARKRLGAEGEQRVQQILEAFENQGVRAPESGLFGEPLRRVRAVRVLETVGGSEARAVLEEMAKGPAEDRGAREARAALEVFPEGR